MESPRIFLPRLCSEGAAAPTPSH